MRCVGIPAGAFFSEKMTSLEISDMYLVDFDIFDQYLNNIWSMFVQQVSVQVYMSPTEVVHTWSRMVWNLKPKYLSMFIAANR